MMQMLCCFLNPVRIKFLEKMGWEVLQHSPHNSQSFQSIWTTETVDGTPEA
jgi:hypothetical protein